MTSEALHFQYRPLTFDEMAGNEASIDMVRTILERGIESVPRTWLFTGESGTGKTTMARIIKSELDCSDTDFHEFNSSNTRGIDTIREISTVARLAPMDGSVKIFLLDEFHMATTQAQNAALKMLEDTPPNTFFFLATTNPEKLKKAIKTRCTTIKLKSLSYKVLSKYLIHIAELEGINGYPVKIANAVAKASQGSCREAVKILDQIIDIGDDEIAMEAIESSLGSESDVAELCKALLKGSPWKTVAKILQTLDMEPEAARHVILAWFTKVMYGTEELRIAELLECFEKNYYDTGRSGLALSCRLACEI